MSTKTFEEVVKAELRDVLLKSGQYSNISYTEPDLGAWRLQMEVILAAHQADLDAKMREAREEGASIAAGVINQELGTQLTVLGRYYIERAAAEEAKS